MFTCHALLLLFAVCVLEGIRVTVVGLNTCSGHLSGKQRELRKEASEKISSIIGLARLTRRSSATEGIIFVSFRLVREGVFRGEVMFSRSVRLTLCSDLVSDGIVLF